MYVSVRSGFFRWHIPCLRGTTARVPAAQPRCGYIRPYRPTKGVSKTNQSKIQCLLCWSTPPTPPDVPFSATGLSEAGRSQLFSRLLKGPPTQAADISTAVCQVSQNVEQTIRARTKAVKLTIVVFYGTRKKCAGRNDSILSIHAGQCQKERVESVSMSQCNSGSFLFVDHEMHEIRP